MTTRLYHQDSYLAEVEAEIVRREQSADGSWRVFCDQTIFCPRGGGQPEDQGTVSGILVTGLAEEGDEIVHLLGADPGQGKASLKIDFSRRYDHMQQHTAQHLLSQQLVRSYAVPTLSFAIGPDHSSIELGVENLSDEQLDALEEACLAVIAEARPVRIVETADAASVPLRKPPKKQGMLRVVEIAGYDHSACGGTHLRNTAEIGLIKIVRTDKVRGNLRIYYLAGHRALRDYQKKNRFAAGVQRLVTLPLEEIPRGIEAIIAERDELGRALKALRRREFDAEIERLAAGTELLVVRRFEAEAGIDEMKYFTAALLKAGKSVLAYSPALQYALVGRGAGAFDLRRISQEVFGLLGGRGGGRESLIEGKAADFSRIEELISLLQKSLVPS